MYYYLKKTMIYTKLYERTKNENKKIRVIII